MAMRTRRYDAKRIPQYVRSRATLEDATGIASADTMVIDFGVKSICVIVEITFRS